VVVLKCEVGVTNTEPYEDNSILVVKVAQITVAMRGILYSDL